MRNMETYLLKRLQRINSVMTQLEMSVALGVHENSIRNWMKDPASIKAGHFQDIRLLHIKLRHKIAWKEKQEAKNGE